jgi:hypothetical protein
MVNQLPWSRSAPDQTRVEVTSQKNEQDNDACRCHAREPGIARWRSVRLDKAKPSEPHDTIVYQRSVKTGLIEGGCPREASGEGPSLGEGRIKMSAVILGEPGASFPYNFRIWSEALVDFVPNPLILLALPRGIEPLFSP